MTGLGRRSLASGVAGVLIGLLAGCGVTRGDDSRDILMIIRRLLESLAPAGHRRGFSGRSDGEAQGRG